MENLLNVGGASKMAPLISFYTILDIDYGLTQLIKEEYFDQSVFKKEFFDRNPLDIISDLYNRRDINPLYIMSKDGASIPFLDTCYKEFMETKCTEVYDKSITTNMMNLISNFNNSNDIEATILCYNEEQLDIVNNEDILANNDKILITDIDNFNNFEQLFFKYIDEARPFSDLRYKSFYFSSYLFNVPESNDDLINPELVEKILQNKNLINIFDIYKKSIIERNKDNE